MVFQVIVRDLSGRSRCIQLGSASVTGGEVIEAVCRQAGIAPSAALALRLYTGTRLLSRDSSIPLLPDGSPASCHVSVALLGGKGGFGSLLRGSATRAGQKKTSNFDACRDMSGRRLRHVNAEKKLKEWKQDAQERDLEKAAQKYIKKLAKDARKGKEDVKAVNDLKERSAEAMDRVAEAVQLAMKRSAAGEGKEENKRRKTMVGLGGSALAGLEDIEEEEDDEEESEEQEDSEDEEEERVEEEEGEGEEEEAGKAEVGKGNGVEDEEGGVTGGKNVQSKIKSEIKASLLPPLVGAEETKGSLTDGASVGKSSGSSSPASSADEKPGKDATHLLTDGELDWSRVSDATALEALGLDGLKAELTKAGLKCGGTLQERAGRLFLLKSTPVEKLDKKHLARPAGKK